MRTSTALVPFLSVLLHLSTQVSAIFFTSPQASTLWAVAAGESVTWHYQPGDATKGTLMLAADDASSAVVVAADVDLRSEQLSFPSGIVFTPTATGTYLLRFVNSDNPSYVYSSVGPFAIQSLGTLATVTSSSTHGPAVTNPKASPTLTEGGGNNGTTEPAVSTAVATKATSSTPAPTISPLPASTTFPTTPPAASATPTPASAATSDDNVATVVVTASAVEITSTRSSSPNSNASLATRLPASGTASRSPAASSSTSSAESVRVGAVSLALAVLFALAAL